jgi:large subunit ribosomal protein L7A
VLDSLKNGKKTIGIKQTLKAVENDIVKTVFIAKDADERVTRPILELCRIKNVEVQLVESMKHLGKACGIEVGAAAVGLLK